MVVLEEARLNLQQMHPLQYFADQRVCFWIFPAFVVEGLGMVKFLDLFAE